MEIHWGFSTLFAWLFVGSILTNFLWGCGYSEAHSYRIFKGIPWGLIMGHLSFFYINLRK